MLVRDGSHIGHVSESASTFVVPVFLGDGLLLAFEGWWAGSTGGRGRPSRSGRSGALTTRYVHFSNLRLLTFALYLCRSYGSPNSTAPAQKKLASLDL